LEIALDLFAAIHFCPFCFDSFRVLGFRLLCFCIYGESWGFLMMVMHYDVRYDLTSIVITTASNYPTPPKSYLQQISDDRASLNPSSVYEEGATTKEQPKVNSNFHPLVADPVFDGVNISIPHSVVEKAGLEDVLESGPWMIRNTLIILKKWSMSTSLLKEELTRIPIWVKLHDVPLQVFEEDDINLIAPFIGKPIMLDSYTSSMCNDSWGSSSFTRCLIKVNSEADLVDVVTIVTPPIVSNSNVVTPTIEKANDGFQTVGKKKKGKSTSTSSNSDNITSSNSFSALNAKEEEEEEVAENMYDETANLFPNTKTGGGSSFTVAVG
ncbi:zinc knuckle CX2CX4HX4C containing protein, partial [Tanacetum coccineum]